MKSSLFPNFIIAGAPKCGTTSLYNYLQQHPEVYMPEVKEPCFFFSETASQLPPWTSIRTLKDYQKLFQPAQHAKAIGEASTAYLYSKTAAATIKQCIPKAKIIAILRDPAERAYSHYWFAFQQGTESITSFEEALNAENRGLLNNAKWQRLYIRSGFYYQQLRRFIQHFGEDQVKVYLFEDLKKNPKKLMHNLADYLEISNINWHLNKTHNKTRVPRNVHLYKFFKNFSEQPLIKRCLDTAVKEEWRKIASDKIHECFLNNNKKIPPLSLETRQHLVNLYSKDILSLQDLLHRDLSSWLK